MKRSISMALMILVSLVGMVWVSSVAAQSIEDIRLLGKYIFFDKISVPTRMSCSTCHNPSAGWTGKFAEVNQTQVGQPGANPHTDGTLKPPSNAYAPNIPFQLTGVGPTGYQGGNFWNGRSEGNLAYLFPIDPPLDNIVDTDVFDTDPQASLYGQFLGPIADQALNPFGNPVEQNIDRIGVCHSVESAKYAQLFTTVWGTPVDCTTTAGVNKSFKRFAVALAAWQMSPEVNSFSSKRDIALQQELDCRDDPFSSPVCEHPDFIGSPGTFPLVGLTDQENYGHDLFYATFFRPVTVNGVPKFANCTLCHLSSVVAPDGTDPEERYTDDSYHNIGTPANPEITGNPPPNEGLAGHTGIIQHLGFHKTTTLRNVGKVPPDADIFEGDFVKAYTHNGWFKSLESIVHFYNTAAMQEDLDALPPFFPPALRIKQHDVTRCPPEITTEKDALANNCWPAPEYPSVAIPVIIGNLGLTPEDEAAIVAYLRTLTDTYTPKPPKPWK